MPGRASGSGFAAGQSCFRGPRARPLPAGSAAVWGPRWRPGCTWSTTWTVRAAGAGPRPRLSRPGGHGRAERQGPAGAEHCAGRLRALPAPQAQPGPAVGRQVPGPCGEAPSVGQGSAAAAAGALTLRPRGWFASWETSPVLLQPPLGSGSLVVSGFPG